jgi:hypothetical protein
MPPRWHSKARQESGAAGTKMFFERLADGRRACGGEAAQRHDAPPVYPGVQDGQAAHLLLLHHMDRVPQEGV